VPTIGGSGVHGVDPSAVFELPRYQMTALPADPYPPEEDGEDRLNREYHALSYADLVERLFREFEDHVTLTDIADVVRESRRQLQGCPPHALPELTERLARQRLTRLADAEEPDPERTPDPEADTHRSAR
jgi:hypothetical protein